MNTTPSASRWFPAVVAASITAAFLGLGHAQDRESPRPVTVGTVDLSRVFRKYTLTRKLARELREWKAKRDADIVAKEKQLNASRDALVTAEGGAAKNAHQTLVSTNKSLGELKGKGHVEYAKRLLGNDRQVYANIRAAVSAVVKERGLDIALQVLDDDISGATKEQQALKIRQRTVLAASEALDITDDVLDHLEIALEEEEEKKEEEKKEAKKEKKKDKAGK